MENTEKNILANLIKETKPICNYCGTYLKGNFICPSCNVDNSDDYKEYFKTMENMKKEDKFFKESDNLWLEVSIKQDIKEFNKEEESKRQLNQKLEEERKFVEKMANQKFDKVLDEKLHYTEKVPYTRKEVYLFKKLMILIFSWILFISIGYGYTSSSYICSPYSNCVSYAYPFDYILLFGIFVILIIVTFHFIYEINMYINKKRNDKIIEKKDPICINGKYYPLWSNFIHDKHKWIGGELIDYGDSFDRATGYEPCKGKIIDVILKPNGKTSAWFSFKVKESNGRIFEVGGDTSQIGISGDQEGKPWLVFAMSLGHKFKIKEKGD